MQKQLDEAEISYRELRKEGEMARKRLISAAENAAIASSTSMNAMRASGSASETAHRGMVAAVPTGNLISQVEAAARPFSNGPKAATRMSTHASADSAGNKGYQAPTLSSVNQMKTTTSYALGDAQNRGIDSKPGVISDPMDFAYEEHPASYNPQLRRDQVPRAVDIPVEDLNDILGAVGGLKSSASSARDRVDNDFNRPLSGLANYRNGMSRSGDDSNSISVDSLLLRRPPGGNPVGPPAVHGQDSSDSSLFSVERQLQHLVDIALDPTFEGKAKTDNKSGLIL
jgi:hypothetical protein